MFQRKEQNKVKQTDCGNTGSFLLAVNPSHMDCILSLSLCSHSLFADMEQKMLLLEGLPDQLGSMKSKLFLYFRNKRKSGGEVFQIQEHPSDGRKALLVYLHDEDLQKVLQRGKHTVDFKDWGPVELRVKSISTNTPLRARGAEEPDTTPSRGPETEKQEKVPFCREESKKEKGKDEEGTLLVRCQCPLSEDWLLLYFEQFSEDVSIMRHGENQWIIRMSNLSDAQKVLAKEEHNINGSALTVELYDEGAAESKLDPRRFVLSGFTGDCKHGLIPVYIKSCSKGAEHSWEVLTDEKSIAVTFKEDIDIQAFLKKCSGKKFQNLEISVSRLEHTDTVLVKGEMDNISDEALQLYFTSKRSKGGEIKSLHWINRTSSVIVTFEHWQVAQRVAEQKHHLCGVSLNVQLFYSTLQEALAGETSPLPTFPRTVTFPLDSEYLGKIYLHERLKEHFERTLREAHAKLSIERTAVPPQVLLEMSLDPSTLLLYHVAPTWESDAQKAMQDLLETYTVFLVAAKSEVWERIKDRCLNTNSDDVHVSYNSTSCTVVLVGHRGEAKRVEDNIKVLVMQTDAELETERSTVEKSFPVQAKEELDFLWNLVSGKLGDVESSVDEANLSIHLKGLQDKVSSAEATVKEAHMNLAIQTLNLSAHKVEYLKTFDIKKFVADHFVPNCISAVILDRGHSYQILVEKKDLPNAENKINDVLKEEVIDLTPDQVEITKGENWRHFYNELNKDVESFSSVGNVRVSHKDKQIVIVGFGSAVADITRKVKGYLNDKVPATEEVPLKSEQEMELIRDCMNLQEEPDIKALDIMVLPSQAWVSPCLKVTAAREKIKEAVSVVKKHTARIMMEKHTFSKAGEFKVLEKNQAALKARGKELRCKLFFSNEKDIHACPFQRYSLKITGSITLTITQGDITCQMAEVLVCPLSSTTAFNNPVAQQLLHVGGPQIQDVPNKLLAEGNPLQPGDVILSPPGQLSAKTLIYAGIPVFGTGVHLKPVTLKCLTNAEDKQCVSIAMPPLGCATFSFPVRESCKAIMAAVLEFCRNQQKPPKNLTNILIVDPDAKIVEEFISAVKEMGTPGMLGKDSSRRPSARTIFGKFPLSANKQNKAAPSVAPKTANARMLIGCTLVVLKKGDITKEQVDAIVNSTNSSLDLDTGVSGAILKAAGTSVMDECAQLGKQKADAVVVTGGGSLNCSYIIQMVGPTNTDGITASMEKVLQLCETKKCTSLSVPAIGTGRGNIGPKNSIEAMLKGLENHSTQTAASCIRSMFIVSLDQKVFDSYCDYFAERNKVPFMKQATTVPSSAPVQSNLKGLPDHQVKIRDVRLELKKGSIIHETVRGIVNTTNKDLNLTGGVSGAIFRAAGNTVQEECKKLGPLDNDKVMVTSGGSLHCDHIVHMLGPHSTAEVTSHVERVLEACEKNQITTVSFPAVGTGGGGLKATDVTSAMLQGFENHLSRQTSTVLKLVYIVIDQDQILQDFLEGFKKWTTKTKTGSSEDLDANEDWTTTSEDEDLDLASGTIEVIMGPVKVKALYGDITKEMTDAIVSSTNTSLNLSSGVSGAILKAAGTTVVDECKALGTQPNDGVVITKAGNLKVKHIVHMVGQTTEKGITNSVVKVLKACDSVTVQSVAFPALGTGVGNLPANKVAQAMIDAVKTFLKDHPNPSVTLIHIVIFQQKIMSSFEEVMKKSKKVTPQKAAGKTVAAQSTASISDQSQVSPKSGILNPVSLVHSVSYPAMTVEVYGTSSASLAQVKEGLEKLVREECSSQEVETPGLDLLNDSEKLNILALARKNQVWITAQSNKFTVSGKKDDVLMAVLQMKDLVQKAKDRENEKQDKERVRRTVRWEKVRYDSWRAMDSSVSYSLEVAYHEKKKTYVYQHRGETFTVDFEQMQQTDSKGRTVKIKRSLLADSDTAVIQPPPTWTKMDRSDMEVVPLPSASEEFQRISKEFVQSCQDFTQSDNKTIEIIQIQRVQNKEQWQRYAVRKQAVDKKYPSNKNEQILYHGTTKDICQKINANGFNRSFCGRNATKYGHGTYFAREAYYSCYDNYSNPDENGHKYMYRARVLTGKACLGNGKMKEPTALNPSDPLDGLHDCAVDNLQNPFIYVIFCDAGAYPEYLISFKAV
ncbi:protein mono-ADP-ribosyltransferase PARP14 [Scleropages formosus]|uniref:protein mono-ADP-ribosyltransferase PARP14 n=1 Tax=Scleropages formosus TaxID=113540 RepID=UPI0010FA7368|nr:protein mono-ADP-ribosyltransferase PARP14-like [Scleropages formosus]